MMRVVELLLLLLLLLLLMVVVVRSAGGQLGLQRLEQSILLLALRLSFFSRLASIIGRVW